MTHYADWSDYESHWKHYLHHRRRIGNGTRSSRSSAQTREQGNHRGSAKGHLDTAVKANPGIEAMELDVADPGNITLQRRI
jgi:hypothetical protein